MNTIDQISQSAPSGALYHYTTQAGFLGIVASKVIWATNVYFMNDAAEVRHAASIAIDCIRDLTSGGDEETTTFGQNLGKALANLEELPVFCCSFSEARDQLSQWRAYASGCGMAVAFEPAAIAKIAMHNGYRLVKCIYDQERQRKIATDAIARALDAFHGARSKVRLIDAMENSIRDFLSSFPLWAAAIKHSAFVEEQEWRLVSNVLPEGDANTRFRSGVTCILPYQVIDLAGSFPTRPPDGREHLGFHDVLLGPTSAPDRQWRAVLHLLVSKNVYFRQITPSGTPYRIL